MNGEKNTCRSIGDPFAFEDEWIAEAACNSSDPNEFSNHSEAISSFLCRLLKYAGLGFCICILCGAVVHAIAHGRIQAEGIRQIQRRAQFLDKKAEAKVEDKSVEVDTPDDLVLLQKVVSAGEAVEGWSTKSITVSGKKYILAAWYSENPASRNCTDRLLYHIGIVNDTDPPKLLHLWTEEQWKGLPGSISIEVDSNWKYNQHQVYLIIEQLETEHFAARPVYIDENGLHLLAGLEAASIKVSTFPDHSRWLTSYACVHDHLPGTLDTKMDLWKWQGSRFVVNTHPSRKLYKWLYADCCSDAKSISCYC